MRGRVQCVVRDNGRSAEPLAMSTVWRRLFKGFRSASPPDAVPPEATDHSAAHVERGAARPSPGLQSPNANALIIAGHALEDRGEVLSALDLYHQAASVEPNSPRARMNIANALRALHRRDEALEALRAAVGCQPDYAPVRFNLGTLLKECGDHAGAERELLAALALQPTMVEALVVLADLYEADRRFRDAETCFTRAVELSPDNAATLLNYGMYLSRRQDFDRALDVFARAKAREPGFADVYSTMLFSLNLRTDVDVQTISDLHLRVGARITDAAGLPFTTWENRPAPERQLRIGYASGDFLMHPVAVFLRPILEQHDRHQFDVYCYSNYGRPDAVGDFLRERSDHWREIAGVADDDLCDLIRRDGIDVLVDLSGHTARHRLPVFARHPAPVQVTWLGYLNTTGLPAMDYRICDWHTDPEDCDQLNSETLIRMPASQWCYMPWYAAESVHANSESGGMTIRFGSFNQDRKISDACLGAWSQILQRVPQADLVVLDFPDAALQKIFIERAERLGIDAARISIRGRSSIADYFASIGSVDVALDTFPYGGATTTLDTLWMGVPIVALRGERGISRGSYSILKSLGADELIAYSEAEYIDLNVRLATDAHWRQRLRDTLRDRLIDSPLMGASDFTRALESRYRQMWRTWCATRK